MNPLRKLIRESIEESESYNFLVDVPKETLSDNVFLIVPGASGRKYYMSAGEVLKPGNINKVSTPNIELPDEKMYVASVFYTNHIFGEAYGIYNDSSHYNGDVYTKNNIIWDLDEAGGWAYSPLKIQNIIPESMAEHIIPRKDVPLIDKIVGLVRPKHKFVHLSSVLGWGLHHQIKDYNRERERVYYSSKKENVDDFTLDEIVEMLLKFSEGSENRLLINSVSIDFSETKEPPGASTKNRTRFDTYRILPEFRLSRMKYNTIEDIPVKTVDRDGKDDFFAIVSGASGKRYMMHAKRIVLTRGASIRDGDIELPDEQMYIMGRLPMNHIFSDAHNIEYYGKREESHILDLEKAGNTHYRLYTNIVPQSKMIETIPSLKFPTIGKILQLVRPKHKYLHVRNDKLRELEKHHDDYQAMEKWTLIDLLKKLDKNKILGIWHPVIDITETHHQPIVESDYEYTTYKILPGFKLKKLRQNTI